MKGQPLAIRQTLPWKAAWLQIAGRGGSAKSDGKLATRRESSSNSALSALRRATGVKLSNLVSRFAGCRRLEGKRVTRRQTNPHERGSRDRRSEKQRKKHGRSLEELGAKFGFSHLGRELKTTGKKSPLQPAPRCWLKVGRAIPQWARAAWELGCFGLSDQINREPEASQAVSSRRHPMVGIWGLLRSVRDDVSTRRTRCFVCGFPVFCGLKELPWSGSGGPLIGDMRQGFRGAEVSGFHYVFPLPSDQTALLPVSLEDVGFFT